ncbi:isoprenylcysteine carboxyl methyltransferase family protein [Deinococcus ruber]|uniref:Isoprenylcysteine carboxyl methyltransferase n=1 Tax=Deinococcus ruber TaxID=1848197 RepID=A0A918F536_9DEIO|nr:isoprenylcysteine carboxyl methyltransferase family protein [Deinococcus ruber]GGR02140.1 isoprenylcysteine carboxyl methyltransferase [Deinococcus ruber]
MKASRFALPLVLGLSVQRLLELRVARQHEMWARENGATEYGREHYPLFMLLHGGWLLATLLEGRRSNGKVNWWWFGLLLLAQPLRYWVISTLGKQWNTRILIVPGASRIVSGPFQYLKHPNYAVVALEMASAPLSVGAWRSALIGSLLNAALLRLIRIPAEERALAEYRAAND